MKVNLEQAKSYIKYQLESRHKKGHGIHSPFLYDVVSLVFLDKKRYPQYAKIESFFNELRELEEKVEIEEFGAGSNVFKDNYRKIGDLVTYAGVPKKYGRLLFRLVSYFKPKRLLELGSSLGLSGLYMALGNASTEVISVEGDKNLARWAQSNARKIYVDNISFLHSSFDDYFTSISDEEKFQMVFIDGDHSYDSTLKYFEIVDELCPEGLLIFDDIHWSAGMNKAWEEICRKSKEYICVDIFRFGLVFKAKGITPGRFTIRY